MSFGAPYFLLAFLPLVFAAWRLLRRGRNRGIKFSAFSRVRSSSGGWRAAVASVSPWILLLSLVLLVIAAARPRTALSRQTRSVDAIAMAMTVDISGSMLALDLAPKECLQGKRPFTDAMTRLSVVKKLFAEFVGKRPDDLIGLVTFGGYAATRVPLTADHAALLKVLEGVEVPTASFDSQGRDLSAEEQMTAIGDGLAVALARLKEAAPSTKVAILLSDGMSNTGAVAPEEAAEAAAKLGVKVYTIGIGTRSVMTPVMRIDLYGRKSVSMAQTGFNKAQLEGIAKRTGGMYFDVNDKNALETALSEIDELEKTRIEADAYDRWDEHFAMYLAAGAMLLFFALSLSMAATRRLA